MKANHNLVVELTPKELAKMLAEGSPQDFTIFWMEWASIVKNRDLDEIAESWKDWNNGKEAFNKFLTMINYHELNKDA